MSCLIKSDLFGYCSWNETTSCQVMGKTTSITLNKPSGCQDEEDCKTGVGRGTENKIELLCIHVLLWLLGQYFLPNGGLSIRTETKKKNRQFYLGFWFLVRKYDKFKFNLAHRRQLSAVSLKSLQVWMGSQGSLLSVSVCFCPLLVQVKLLTLLTLNSFCLFF